MRRLLPSPPPQKSAAWPTRLLHGVLRGYRSVGGGVWPSLGRSSLEPPPLYVLTVTAAVMSASAVSAPPYGKPCSKRGRPKLDSELGRNAAHSGIVSTFLTLGRAARGWPDPHARARAGRRSGRARHASGAGRMISTATLCRLYVRNDPHF